MNKNSIKTDSPWTLFWLKNYLLDFDYRNIKFKKLNVGYPPFDFNIEYLDIVEIDDFIKIEEDRIPLFIGSQFGTYPKIENIQNFLNGDKLIAVLSKSLLSGVVGSLNVSLVKSTDIKYVGGLSRQIKNFRNILIDENLLNNADILINGYPYTSIGNYEDNNDGIGKYYPDEFDLLSWTILFENESILISIWTLGNLFIDYCESPEVNLIGTEIYDFISVNKSKIQEFISKYFEDDEGRTLNHLFEDFIFGAYSDYSSEGGPVNIEDNYEALEKMGVSNVDLIFSDRTTINLLNKNDLNDIDDYWGELRRQVFIKTEYIEQLEKDLNQIISLMLNTKNNP